MLCATERIITKQKAREWVDGTYLDYTAPSDLFGPLDNQCTVMDAYHNYNWNDYSCVGYHNFLCNMPSTICYHDHWTLIQGKAHWERCTLQLNGQMLNHHQQWKNMNCLLVMEMRFKISDTGNGFQGSFGILLYDGADDLCDYYHIGITSNWFVFIDRIKDGIFERVAHEPMPITNLNIDFALRIECLNKSEFVIKFKDYTILSYTNGYDEVNNSSQLSGLIGLKSVNMNVTLFSLFVSGRAIDVSYDNVDIADQISECDTLSFVPTFQPTVSPMAIPSLDPTYSPSSFYPSTSPVVNSNKTMSDSPTSSPTDLSNDNLERIKLWIFLVVILLIVLILSVIVSLLCYCKRSQSNANGYVKSPSGVTTIDSDEEDEELMDDLKSIKSMNHQQSHASDFAIPLPKRINNGRFQSWTDNGFMSVNQAQKSAVSLHEVKDYEDDDDDSASEMYGTPKESITSTQRGSTLRSNNAVDAAEQAKLKEHGSEGKDKSNLSIQSPKGIEMQKSDEGQRMSLVENVHVEMHYQTSTSTAL